MRRVRDRVRGVRTMADVARRAGRAGARRRISTGPRAAACTRASSPNCADAPRLLASQELVAAAQGPPLHRRARRHRGPAQPRRDSADRRRRRAPTASIRQTRHAARLDGAAAKASAGAVAHVKIADVVNIARAIDELKDAGVWTVGLDAEAAERLRPDRLHAAHRPRPGRRGAGAAAPGAGVRATGWCRSRCAATWTA